MTPRHKGAFAEYKFVTEAIRLKLNVLLPAIDGLAYDCVIDNGRKFFKIQVKYGVRDKRCKDSYHVKLERQVNKIKKEAKVYKANEVDFYAIYIVSKDLFYIIPYYVPKLKSLSIRSSNEKLSQYANNWDQFL